MKVKIEVPKDLWPRRGEWRGKVIKILTKPGDRISKGDVVAEVEIEKAVLEIETPYSGIVEEILLNEGDSVEPGDALITIKVIE